MAGVTFYGEQSAAVASSLTGAPVREIWVDVSVTPGGTATRLDHSRAIAAHHQDIADANFTSSFVSRGAGNVARSDVGSAGGLVSQAQHGVSRAQTALTRAENMPTSMGSVRTAAIDEAKQALEDAQEALRLAQEALEKAQREMEEDKAAEESDSDTDNP